MQTKLFKLGFYFQLLYCQSYHLLHHKPQIILRTNMEQQRAERMEYWLHFIIFSLILINSATSQSIIDTLPGYAGTLPFKLETGYIGVGENDEVQLFYYFIESESDPRRDPLIFWLTGGPGCSGFSGLVFEIGPLDFDLEDYDGSFPSFTINPYSWTKVASIIFIDAPIGTGFSYATTPEGYASSDTKSTTHNYIFLKKWLSIHPTFIKNRLYIAGDSYSGKIVTMVTLEIAKGNEAGVQPRMFLQGYIIGNSMNNKTESSNDVYPYAHRMALISDEYFELAKNTCHGKYANPDPENLECLYAIQLMKQCLNNINDAHILEPKCTFLSPKTNNLTWGQPLLEDDPARLLFLPNEGISWCRNQNYATSYVWANDETVQQALHIRKGTKTYWTRCNKSLAYEEDVESVFKHHQLLSEKGYQALAYSGDHDMGISYMSTLKWIRELNLTVDDNWRAWTVDGQVAGYTEKYKNNQAFLTFATVKGAGHTAPEYKPKECFEMLKRWLSLYPL